MKTLLQILNLKNEPDLITKIINIMTAKTFISGTGTAITTANKSEIKKLKACGWLERKPVKKVFAKGLQDGKAFLD